MTVLFYITFFILGLILGSFLNCLVYRLANNKTILGRSFCPYCHHKITWKDNIPLLSFIFLKGRCRYCQKKISWQYPLVELITGLLFLLPLKGVLVSSGLVVDISFIISVLIDWLVYFGLVFIFVFDLKYMLVADEVVLPIIGGIFLLKIGLFLFNDQSFFTQFNPLIGAVFIGLGFFALQYLITRGKGIGLGDLRIGVFMGVIFGHWKGLFLAIILSYFIGSLISLGLIVFKKKGFKSHVPLGPFLVIGTFISYLFQEEIINWYLGLL